MLAGTALLAGQGDYTKWANQYLGNQWSQAAQIQNARLMAMAQAAQENARQQSQQAFQMQMMPMQAAQEAQQQAFQSNLGMQANAQQQALQSYYGGQQSQQDFGEQQALQAQRAAQQAQNEAAQLQLQQQGQLANQQQMAQFNSDQHAMQSFTDGSYQQRLQQIQQQATEQGADYTPEQQAQITQSRKILSSAQDALGPQDGAGTATSATLRPAVLQAMRTLSTVLSNPGKPPPPTTAEWIAKNVTKGLQDPSSGQIIPGTENTYWYKTAKGEPKPWEPKNGDAGGTEVGEDGQIINEKTRGLKLTNQIKERKVNLDREDWVQQKLDKFVGARPMAAADPTWPQQIEMEKQRLYQTYDQAAHMTPSGVEPVGPTPQAQITPQNPQGQQPPAPGIPAQNTGGRQPQQPVNFQQIQTVVSRLKATPRDRWTPEDWMRWKQIQTQLGM